MLPAALHMSVTGTKLPIAALNITADIEGRTDMSRTSRDGRSDHLCHSMINFAVMHTSVLAQWCGNMRPQT
jgi:hypothetical protein